MHTIRALDAVFCLIGLLLLLARPPGRVATDVPWQRLAAAVLFTALAAYEAIRLALEFRVGVSVSYWPQESSGPDSPRSARPAAFWWAITVEVAVLTWAAWEAVRYWGQVAGG